MHFILLPKHFHPLLPLLSLIYFLSYPSLESEVELENRKRSKEIEKKKEEEEEEEE